MDLPTIPPSAFRQPPPPPPPPPPPSRCSDGSDSNMLTKTTMLSGGKRRFRRCKKERKTNIESLPEELLFDILVRLPADFLYDTARLVCRRWCHSIRSDAFINTQMQQYNISAYGLVLSSPLSECYPHSIYVTATQGGLIKTSELSDKIMASGNGLAVELRHVDVNGESLSLHVINPTTKQSFLLPWVSAHNRDVFHEQCGIAYSAASMEYKVTLPYNVNGELACLDIVTVGVDKSWRHVEIPPLLEGVRSLFYSFPLSSEGFLHWGRGIYCLTMNVETEIFTMSEPPIPRDQRYDHYSYYYLSTGRYLTLLVGRKDFSWEVWEMKLAESGEWRKVVPNIDLEDQKCRLEDECVDFDERLFPIGWVKYLEVLAFCFPDSGETCIFYNLETHEIDTIDLPHHACRDYRAIVHRNSLAWLSQE